MWYYYSIREYYILESFLIIQYMNRMKYGWMKET